MLGHGSYKALVITGALLLSMLAAATANAATKVYFTTENSYIGVTTLNGSKIDATFISGGSETCGNIAVSRKYIYWTNAESGAIGRATLDGHDVNQNFINGAGEPCGISVYAGHLYWDNFSPKAASIGRANLAGKAVNESFITGADFPCGITVSAGRLYWPNEGNDTIARANVNGTGVNQNFITGASTIPCGIAVNSSYIYWGNVDSGAIGRARISGKGADKAWIPEATAQSALGVAVTSKYLYWDNQDNAEIGRANLNGTDANAGYIHGASGNDGLGIGPPSTSTKLSRSAKTAKLGKRVTYTAAISPVPDGGSVRFTSNGKTIHGCKAVKVSLTTGRASCHATYHAAGKQTVKASYAGDSDFYGSKSSAVRETVKR